MSVAFNYHGFDRDVKLTNLMLEYGVENPDEYIFDKVLGTVQVEKGTGKYPLFVPSEKNRIPDDEDLANDGFSAPTMVSTDSTEDVYETKDMHVGAPVTAREMKDFDIQSGVDPRVDAVATDWAKYRGKCEKSASDLLNTAANWAAGHTSTPGTLWDAAGSTPVDDIWAAIALAKRKTGRKTKLMFWSNFEVYTVLARHTQLVEFTKYTQAGFVPAEIIAAMFGVDEYHIGSVPEELSGRGDTNQNLDDVWGKDFGIGYRPSRDSRGMSGKRDMSTGKIFVDVPPMIDTYQAPANKGRLITLSWAKDFKPFMLDKKQSAGGKLIGGYLYKGVIS